MIEVKASSILTELLADSRSKYVSLLLHLASPPSKKKGGRCDACRQDVPITSVALYRPHHLLLPRLPHLRLPHLRLRPRPLLRPLPRPLLRLPLRPPLLLLLCPRALHHRLFLLPWFPSHLLSCRLPCFPLRLPLPPLPRLPPRLLSCRLPWFPLRLPLPPLPRLPRVRPQALYRGLVPRSSYSGHYYKA